MAAASRPLLSDSAAVLFPGALGDFICFLPTLRALRERHTGPVLLVAKFELHDLVRMSGVTTASIDRREIADLFVVEGAIQPTTIALFGGFDRVYSWTGFGNTNFMQRLAATSGGEVSVHAFRGMRPGEHATDYFARCAGVSTVPIDAGCIRRDTTGLRALAGERLLVVHPGSGSPSKNWQGFAALVRAWRARRGHTVVWLSGPAEASRPQSEPGMVSVDGLSLPQVSALLDACDLYLGNDSGISHLAAAVGARGVVLFASTDPVTWAPRSTRLHVVHAPRLCSQCTAGAFCIHRLPVDAVVHALETLSVES